jgi:16S rRNA (adenine1518-N6/adenine1519-N6)-dimethyltransferase
MPPPRADKQLGQHFLVSEEVVKRILNALEASSGETVLEIGPGRGALTMPLARSGVDLVAVEFDEKLVRSLSRQLPPGGNVRLLALDFLSFEPPGERLSRFALVGNIPYNITSPVLDWCVKHRQRIDRAVLMVQQELARRAAAAPGGKDWSPLAILTQLYFDVACLFDVAPDCFQPPPKVTSTVIRLRPKAVEPEGDLVAFEKVVRAAFGHRRKLLRNSLAAHLAAEVDLVAEAIAAVGLPSNSRAEQLTARQFFDLTRALDARNIL